jgi:hypothetical protein
MPTLTIGDRKVTVDDGFLKLSPEQQNATVEEIAASLPKAPAATVPKPLDKYQQAAVADRADLVKKGIDPADAGAVRLGLQGTTFNLADEAIAGMATPIEMFKRGTLDPREGYRYAKAQEDLRLEEGRKKLGWGGATAAEIAGGVGSGVGLARAGLTAGRWLGQSAGLLPRSAAAAADASVMGAVAGAGEGNTFDERFGNAVHGGAIGGGLGAATPGALKVAGVILSPAISNVRARVNPEGYARSQVARALNESNLTPQQIAGDVSQAAAEGQGVYTVADAMGNPGQRMLSTATRAPGPGRTDVVDFLEGRQAGQGRRVANTLAEGFDSPVTAAQSEAQLTRARDVAANAEYGQVRTDARPVDLSGTIARIDETLSPGVNQIARPQSNIANDSIEAALQGFRSRLTDGRSTLTDFTAVQRIRGELSDAIEAARRAGQGNRARLLGGVLREMDGAMEAASAGHRQANANFAARSRVIDAIEEGRIAAARGRTEDTIPAFQGMTPQQQAAYRVGYVDPLIGQTQGSAVGANKVRPFTSDAFRQEASVMAPDAPLLTRRLDREGRMFETRNQALGGSRTADNLADQAAMGVDPSLVGNLLSGNWSGVARGALAAGQNALTGNTPAVRTEVGRILTMRGGNVSPQELQNILEQAISRVRLAQIIASQAGRGAAGGLAIADQRLRH